LRKADKKGFVIMVVLHFDEHNNGAVEQRASFLFKILQTFKYYYMVHMYGPLLLEAQRSL
jgi:hypothetical protein